MDALKGFLEYIFGDIDMYIFLFVPLPLNIFFFSQSQTKHKIIERFNLHIYL